VMAIATFWMASKTRALGNQTAKMAEETGKLVNETAKVADATLKEAQAVEAQVGQIERQVELSRKALEIGVQPWLLWDTMGASREEFVASGNREDTEVTGTLIVKNIGAGIAVLDMERSLI